MSMGCFTDKLYQPTSEEILEAISKTKPLWDRLHSFIVNNYSISGSLKFYGKNYGWAIAFSKGGKALTSLYPGTGCFTVQIILNSTQVEEALNSDISISVKRIINDTPQIHEGKWIFIRVTTDTQIDDIEKLLMTRVKPKNKNPRGNGV